ncbi:MAG TPA: dihydroorotate dehydrogenase [Euryarchaeota archaeon]|nr:dihydroorotate dehydrogenase [Euryarchaeota archaeon]
MNVSIEVELFGQRMKNPTMLASGILGTTADLLLSAVKGGAGAVVTKSIGKKPRDGHANPTVFEYNCGMLNALGLPNPGIDHFEKELSKLKGKEIFFIGSVFGSDGSEFSELAVRMERAGASAVELNLSCPHAKGLGAEIGSDPESVEIITQAVASSVEIPVIAKLTPNTSDIVALGKAAERGGADAVVAINTLKAMAIEPYLRKPALGNVIGGLSGQAVKPVGLRCVYELYEALDIPIIGAGGIESGIDAVEYLMAGASAVQVGTAIRGKGMAIFAEICAEIEDFMRSEGYKEVGDLRGLAHD